MNTLMFIVTDMNQCWVKLLLKVMHYSIVLLPKLGYLVAFYGK